MASDKNGSASGPRPEGIPARPSPAWRSIAAITAAALLFLVPLILFVLLAEDVAEREVLPFDRPVMEGLHSISASWLTAVMEAVTQLGGLVVVPVAAVVSATVLWRRGSRTSAVLLAAAVVGSTVLNSVLKAVFRRARPDFWEHLVTENSYSFPSGHAMATMSLAAGLVVLAWGTRWRWATVVAGAVYVLAVGISRMYLGVHFPSDVLAGWCVSLAWVAVVVVVLRVVAARSRRSPEGAGSGADDAYGAGSGSGRSI